MAKIRRSFARSDRTIGVNTGVGATINPSAATAPGRALAQGAEQAGAAVSSALQKKAKRDTAIIIADQASKQQELTLRDLKDAQLNSKSNLEAPDFSGQITDLDLVVNTPGGGEHNNKAYTDYVMGRFDERAQQALNGVAGPARAGLAAELGTLRQQTLRDALAFEGRETRRIRRNHARDIVDRNGRAVFDNPLLFDVMLEKQNLMIDAAQIGQGDQKNTKGALANNLAANAMRGLIALSPETALKELANKKSTIRQNLKGSQIETFINKAKVAEEKNELSTQESVQGLYEQSLDSLRQEGTAAPGIETMLRENFKGEELLDKLSTLKATEALAPIFDRIKSAPLDKAIDIRDEVLSNMKFGSTTEKKKAGELLRAEVNKHIAQMQNDPALAVREYRQEEFDKIAEDDLLNRYRETLRYQKLASVAGTKMRGMTNAERDGFIHTINTAKPDQLLQLVGSLRDQMRTPLGEVDHTFRFFKELLDKPNGLNPLQYMFVHNMELPVAQDIIGALQFQRSDIGKKLKKDENRDQFVSEIKSKINKGLDSWANQTIGPEEEWKRTVNNVKESAVHLTEYYMSEFGLSDQEAVNKSINGLVGDHVIDTARKSRVVKNMLFDGMEVTTKTGDKAILMNGQWMTFKDGQWVPLNK